MNEEKIDLLAIGDVSVDLFLAVDEGEMLEDFDTGQARICFFHGSKIPVKSIKTTISGNTINVSMGTKQLGLSTAIYTVMGDDEYGNRIEQELKASNIVTKYLMKNKNVQTGLHPVIMYGGERTIFTHHDECEYEMINWPKPKWIYYTSIAPGFDKFQAQLAAYCKNSPDVGLAFNPGTYHIKAGVERLKNILEVTHVLFVNKEEAIRLTLTNDTSIENLHKMLQKLGPKLTIITDGANGSSGYDGNTMCKIDAIPPASPIVDKTGAGDAFSSGAMSALFYNKPLLEVLAWGAINSSSVLTQVGSIHGLKTKKEMEDIMNNLKLQ